MILDIIMITFEKQAYFMGVIFIDTYMLSDFEKIQTLKQSENKTVYLVKSLKTDEIMIIKELSTENQSYSKLSQLKHKNLQEVYAVFKENNKTYIICEYIIGEKLEVIIQNEKLTDKIIYQLILQLCDAVSFLHNQKPPMIHRDIKLSNIIVDNDYNLKLIDYDTIRELKVNTDYDTVFIGTRGYAPPEQYGFSQTNEKTDIYAIGMLIYRLLGGYNEQSISNYKGKYKKVIQKATSFSPDMRFKTVKGLRNRIKFERYKTIVFIAFIVAIIFITVTYLYIINIDNSVEKQNDAFVESSIEYQEEKLLCEFKIGEINYSAMGENKNFAIAPVFDEENGDILVSVDILDSIPNIEYSVDNNNRTITINKQNRKIEFSVADSKALVDNFEVVTDCIPILEKSVYKIPINFTVSNLGLYFQYDDEQKIGRIIDRYDNRILMNTNRLSFQFEKMNFNHSVPVLIGLKDNKYEKTLNNIFDNDLKQYYDKYKAIFDNTIKNNNDNTLFTHNNYVEKKYFSDKFASILMIDNDAQSMEDSDLNRIYRVKDFNIVYLSYNIDLSNKRFLTLWDLINEADFKNLIRQRLLELLKTEEDYSFINEKNIDNIVSEMNGFFISEDKTLTVYGNLKELSNVPILAEFKINEYNSFLKQDLFS